MRAKRQARERGFTLLELLMVVIIIAILASIALPQYFRTAERTRAAEALQMLATIRSSETRYKMGSQANVFSNDLDDLDVEVGASTIWNYSAAPPFASAARQGGLAAQVISINLFSGKTCAGDPRYGLPPIGANGC